MKTRFKKLLIAMAVSFLVPVSVAAVIAKPGVIHYTQPDGSDITIEIHGDEYNHWTTMNGIRVVLCDDGFYRPEGTKTPQSRKVSFDDIRMTRERKTPNFVPRDGSPHFLVLLIEFSDVHFTVQNPKEAFYALLNGKGYSENGATGSARDYFFDNSSGMFDPQYDVVGPIRLSRTCQHYAQRDEYVLDGLYEACMSIDPELDFSVYDTDKDGIVDNLFFFYAGHNSAEGAPNTIWPHSWCLFTYDCTCDGARVYQYACTSEYRGYSGTQMCGIGTFCHEFGHTLGLLDTYDVDYGSNGYAFTLESYSLMSSGNYNNEGRTPPYLMTEERRMLGWMGELQVLSSGGNVTIPDIRENQAFKVPTSTDDEYFVLETRGVSSWDTYVPGGLLVTQVDKSERDVHGLSAKYRWLFTNNINNYADHPCYRIVPASRDAVECFPFPGRNGVTSFGQETTPAFNDWNNRFTGYELSFISFEDGKSSFIVNNKSRIISGRVSDTSGRPLPGVKIEVSGDDNGILLKTITGKSGEYSINLGDNKWTNYTVSASVDGYVSQKKEFSSGLLYPICNFVLLSEEEAKPPLERRHIYYIDVKSSYYEDGDPFRFSLVGDTSQVKTLNWYFDGEACTLESVTLRKGTHSVKAVFSDETGVVRILEVEISVK